MLHDGYGIRVTEGGKFHFDMGDGALCGVDKNVIDVTTTTDAIDCKRCIKAYGPKNIDVASAVQAVSNWRNGVQPELSPEVQAHIDAGVERERARWADTEAWFDEVVKVSEATGTVEEEAGEALASEAKEVTGEVSAMGVITIDIMEAGKTMGECRTFGMLPESIEPGDGYRIFVDIHNGVTTVCDSESADIVERRGWSKAMQALANHYGTAVEVCCDPGVGNGVTAKMTGVWEPKASRRW